MALSKQCPAPRANAGNSGWDAADAIEEGRALSDIRREAVARAKPFEPPPSYVSHCAYEMTDDGLHVEVETGRGENKAMESKWISAPFEILGACRDPHGRDWGKWIRWKDTDGRRHVQHVAPYNARRGRLWQADPTNSQIPSLSTKEPDTAPIDFQARRLRRIFYLCHETAHVVATLAYGVMR